MNIDETLFTEFARTTIDKKESPKEYVAYGTVTLVDAQGNVSIQLDGATNSMECKSTVTCKEGDRVTVTIKNRQAVITSNLTTNTINADYLVGGDAKFTGTIEGATYKDSTYDFSMEIGSSQSSGGRVSPAFKLSGYLNGNPNNEYLEVDITLLPADGDVVPMLYLTGVSKSSPTSTNERTVSMSIDSNGIHFSASWPGYGNRVFTNLPWSYNP